MHNDEQFKPVRLDTKAELARAMERPGFKDAWDELEEEYAALSELLQARKIRRVGTVFSAHHRKTKPTPRAQRP